jgi:hypothetical protein
VHTDQSHGPAARISLGDLVSEARQRPPHVPLAQDDLLGASVHRFLPGLTGPG